MPYGKYERKKYPYTCEFCGKQGMGNKGQRWCSQSCRRRKEPKKLYTFTCLVCGETKTTKFKRTKICSKKCRNQSRYTLYRDKYLTSYRPKQETKPVIQLVDSICPKCRCKHKGESKWEFCDAHKYLREVSFCNDQAYRVYAP